MAITLDLTTPDKYRVSGTMTDNSGESINHVFYVDGATTELELEAILTNMELCSNAKWTDGPKVSATYEGAGMRTSTVDSGRFQLVAAQAVLNFLGAHPLNANKPVTKAFKIPAPHEGIMDGNDFNPIQDGTAQQDALFDLLAALEAHLIYIDVTDAITADVFDYQPSSSAVITAPSIIDAA